MDSKEKIIEMLINECNKQNCNPIIIDKNDISGLNISEDEAIKILITLNEDGLINTYPMSPHRDFSAFWKIVINTKCLNYFSEIKQKETANRREWVRTYMPITISTIALIISITSLILNIYKLSHGM